MPNHGTYYGYTSGCRCPECTAAATREKKLWRLKRDRGEQEPRVPSIGAERRIQALVTAGWSQQRIAEAMGDTSRGGISRILYRDRPTIGKNLHDRIHRVYEQLSATPGPSARSRAYGQSMGWVPPLAWDDDTIDDPNAVPSGVESPRESFDVDEWFWLVNTGEDPDRAARRCGVTRGTVQYTCSRLGRSAEYVAALARARREEMVA